MFRAHLTLRRRLCSKPLGASRISLCPLPIVHQGPLPHSFTRPCAFPTDLAHVLPPRNATGNGTITWAASLIPKTLRISRTHLYFNTPHCWSPPLLAHRLALETLVTHTHRVK